MDRWPYLCRTVDEMNSTLAQSSTLSTNWLCKLSVGFESHKTPVAAQHSVSLSGVCATKKENSQVSLPCLRVCVCVCVTATQASTSEDFKAALSHLPAPTLSARHSFTLTANISSPFIWHLTVFSVIMEPWLRGPPP